MFLFLLLSFTISYKFQRVSIKERRDITLEPRTLMRLATPVSSANVTLKDDQNNANMFSINNGTKIQMLQTGKYNANIKIAESDVMIFSGLNEGIVNIIVISGKNQSKNTSGNKTNLYITTETDIFIRFNGGKFFQYQRINEESGTTAQPIEYSEGEWIKMREKSSIYLKVNESRNFPTGFETSTNSTLEPQYTELTVEVTNDTYYFQNETNPIPVSDNFFKDIEITPYKLNVISIPFVYSGNFSISFPVKRGILFVSSKFYDKIIVKFFRDKDFKEKDREKTFYSDDNILFIDSCDYYMHVTVFTSSNFEGFAYSSDNMQRIIGSAKNVKVAMRKLQSVDVLMWSTKGGIYSYSSPEMVEMKSINRVYKRIAPSNPGDEIMGEDAFKIASLKSGVETYTLTISNDKEVSNAAVSYEVKSDPVFQREGVCLVDVIKGDDAANDANKQEARGGWKNLWTIGIVLGVVALIGIFTIIGIFVIKKKNYDIVKEVEENNPLFSNM